MDGLQLGNIMALGEFTVVYVDISGNREMRTVVQLIESLRKIFDKTVTYLYISHL